MQKRPNTLLNCSFSSKKICAATENLTSNLNTPGTTIITTTTTNDDFNLFLSSDPEDLDQVSDEVNFSVESNELKVTNSRPDTNTNDIGYYVSNKLSIDDHLKYSLLTNHFKLDRKYSFPMLYSDDHKYSRQFLINWLNDNSFLLFIHQTVSCMGETIANIILDYLTTYNLPFDNSLGQAYDGGSNMVGIYRVLVDSCSISQIRNMMETIKKIINFFKDSPKRMLALWPENTDYQEEYIYLTNKKTSVEFM
ncbi:unnamed protein product [Rotaria sordida]|uniref:DUF4371 domain-containing protein n=1 Tax=Rotaria sordida TaxID=392033 RepID=A0A815L5Q1_9BILA|nr:unnamed protein product [Rotaria sordida]